VKEGFYTYGEAAHILGVPFTRISGMVSLGELRRQRFGSSWMVAAASVQKVLDERGPAGSQTPPRSSGEKTTRRYDDPSARTERQEAESETTPEEQAGPEWRLRLDLRKIERDGKATDEVRRTSEGEARAAYPGVPVPVVFADAERYDSREYFSSKAWKLAGTLRVPSRKRRIFGTEDLDGSPTVRTYLERFFPGGVYLHQKEALQHHLAGRNVCLTTGTASGKSLPFYLCAIDRLARDPSCRIVAMYPMKALGKEQEGRWRRALEEAGLSAKVGRIDGQVPVAQRAEIMRRSSVVIITPDVVHAWLLSNLGDATVLSFLKRVSLVVVDEVHNYTGVFGSNSAFLFRRVQHAMGMLGAAPRYICASATISDPRRHLKKLFGLDFELVGAEMDTSPKHGVDVHLVTPSEPDLMDGVAKYLHHLASNTHARFIAFVDSRKQAELISSMVARSRGKKGDEEEAGDAEFGHLGKLDVLPYRAGYEERDRDAIQERLTRGTLKGVVSTSALELGLDIPHLDTAVLVGVPRSSTSLHQRIGRIGRHAGGTVVVINTWDVYNEAVFAEPESLLKRPLAEGALYLENARIQYIHALCLARDGGEHDRICQAMGLGEGQPFWSRVDWPEGFVETCERERLGEIPVDLQSMKAESGESPNHVFPLRDVESQFKVELRQGPDRRSLGSLGHGQLMREAYPGAVYYYTTQAFRVSYVDFRSKAVQVRREKRYVTKPRKLPTLVFPNLTDDNVYRSARYGDLILAECNLQVRESVCGFEERRGSSKFVCAYPADLSKTGVRFDLPRFTRNYFTTGVVITHPALDEEGVDPETLAALLYEAFFIQIPFERQDINFAVDMHRARRGPLDEGSRFVAIYDQTYGSLRLSSRILDKGMIGRMLGGMLDLAYASETIEINAATRAAIESLCDIPLKEDPGPPFGVSGASFPTDERYERVVLPGSRGLNLRQGNAEFEVEAVFFHPRVAGLAYRGRYASAIDESVKEVIPVSNLGEIPGVSEVGLYDYDTGEIGAVPVLDEPVSKARQSPKAKEKDGAITPTGAGSTGSVPTKGTRPVPVGTERLPGSPSVVGQDASNGEKSARGWANSHDSAPASKLEGEPTSEPSLPGRSAEGGGSGGGPAAKRLVRKEKLEAHRHKADRSLDPPSERSDPSAAKKPRHPTTGMERLEEKLKWLDDEIRLQKSGLMSDEKRRRIERLQEEQRKSAKRLRKLRAKSSRR
jgi:DEAD/DEAH box helicase domain-containing protein